MMLRTLLQGCRRAYTCNCLHQPNLISRLLPPAICVNSDLQRQHAGFHSTPAVLSIDKDIRGKKNVIRMGQLAKEEPVGDAEEMPEIELQGLTDAGVTIPTLETHQMLVDGVPYCELPIVHIKSSPNNTLMIATDHTGTQIYTRNTCGREGFKHVKKSTNVAAQATGLSLGLKAAKLGLTSVRVKVKGIGAGRLASIKGLQMAGLKIVSITDNTSFPFLGKRPPKVRRI